MRQKLIGVAIIVAALGGLACQGGGGINNDPTEQPPPTSDFVDPCYKPNDSEAALAAPATDGCTTQPQSDES